MRARGLRLRLQQHALSHWDESEELRAGGATLTDGRAAEQGEVLEETLVGEMHDVLPQVGLNFSLARLPRDRLGLLPSQALQDVNVHQVNEIAQEVCLYLVASTDKRVKIGDGRWRDDIGRVSHVQNLVLPSHTLNLDLTRNMCQ